MILLLAAAGMAAGLGPDEQRAFADGLYARGLYDMAAREYAAMLDAPGQPEMDVVLFRLGECHRQVGDIAAAEHAYQRLLNEHAAGAYAIRTRFRYGELLIAAGRPAEAAAMLKAVLGQSPAPDIAAAARYNLGYAYAKMDRASDAEREYRIVVKTYADTPFFPHAALELGKLRQNAGRAEEAAALFLQAAESAGTPRVAAEGWFQWAEAAFRRGSYEDSRRGYEKLLSVYPDDVRAREARLQAAWSYYHTGNYTEALDLAESALAEKAGEREADWLYLKGNCERGLDRNEAARATYDRLLAAHPKSAVAGAAAYERALLAFRAGDFDEAIRLAGGTTAPGESAAEDLEWLLAESYAASGRTEDAVRGYRAIIEASPPGRRAAEALFRLARLQREQGKVEEAAGLFRRVAKEHPDHELAAQAVFESAYDFFSMEQYGEAVNDWKTLAERYPQSPLASESLFQMAMAQVRLEREAEALRTLAILVENHPSAGHAAQAHYWLGILTEKAGESETAEKELRTALERGPDAELQRKIRYRLALLLQKRGAHDEAAPILQDLAATPTGDEMSPALLEWLGRYQLERAAFPEAAAAAARLVENAAEPAWKQIGWYLAGRARLGEGKKDEARAAFERAQAQPVALREGAEAALQVGLLSLDSGDITAAEVAFGQAAERSGEADLIDIRARSYYGLGLAAAERAAWADAARYYMSVAVLFDHAELVPECLYRSAEAFGQAGQAGEREKALKELDRRYPQSAWAARARESMGQAPAGSGGEAR